MIEQSSLDSARRQAPLLPLVLLIILGLSWGLHFPIFKFAARSGLPYSGIAGAIIVVLAGLYLRRNVRVVEGETIASH